MSADSRQAEGSEHALRIPYRYSRLPIFTDNGGAIIISPVNPTAAGDPPEHFSVAAGAIDIAWIDRRGAVTLQRHLSFGGDVQSVYASSDQELWLLVARPRLAYTLVARRHYVYVSLSKNGKVHEVVATKAAQWPIQKRSWMSYGGLWMSHGVYWTYNTFEVLRPIGLNWATLKGKFNINNMFSPFVGNVSPSIAPGQGPSVWTLVNADAAGLVDVHGNPFADAVFRFDVSSALPQARHYSLAPQSNAQEITEDIEGGMWFAYRDGRLGRVDASGALDTYRWRKNYDGYPTALMTAPNRGVWVIGEDDIEHYTKNGKVAQYLLPIALRNVPRGLSAVVSPCGIFWFRRSTDDYAGVLSSWRIPGVAKKGCIDGSMVP